MERCIACDLAEGRQPLPGGRIAETDHWLVEHCVGPLGVGALVVKPRRHVTRIAELSVSEAAELGPLLQRTAAVVDSLTAADQIYVSLWSHAGGEPAHIHLVVQPATAEAIEAYGARGPALQAAMFARGAAPDPAEVAAFADAARAALD